VGDARSHRTEERPCPTRQACRRGRLRRLPASRAAVLEAIRRVGADGCLYIVHAYRVPAEYWGTGYYQELVDEIAREGRLPDEIADLSEVEWHAELLAGHPAQAIANVAAARGADEVIVGSRGFGRARALLGSPSHELIHLARCPVTVIPERAVEEPAADPAAESVAS
jgi:nucleotide-binding universal stress UspA family protein